MKSIIKKLKEIAKTSNERASRNIKNLIVRIEYFTKVGDEQKLNECLAEAELWGA